MATIDFISGSAGITTRGLANSSDIIEYRNPIQIGGGYWFELFNVTANELAGTVIFYGNLTLNEQGVLSSGIVTGIKFTDTDRSYWQISCSLPAATFFANGFSAVLNRADTIMGGGLNDNLWGYGGSDTLNGENGNDTLVGGLGNDRLNGGDGYDLLSYYDKTTAITVTLANSGTGSVTIGTEVDTYTSIEGLEGGSGNDRLTGNSGNTDIYGGAGNDIIKGLKGNDYLFGGDGNDKIIGGNDNDWLFGEGGNDLIEGGDGASDGASYYYSEVGVNVDLALQGIAQNTVGEGHDTLRNIEKLEGSFHGDTLSGDSFNNTLVGLDGDDTLVGRNGDDFLIGSAGRDTLNGGFGSDWASYEMAASNSVVDLAKQNIFQDTRGDGYDKLVSIENLFGSEHNDTLYGDQNANTLESGWGNDILDGRAGVDVIIGRQGNDFLTGGADQDIFVFYAGEGGNDKITDLDFTGADKDVVELYGLFTDLNDLLASGVQLAGGFRVILEAGSTLLFAGRTAADVALADFGFYA